MKKWLACLLSTLLLLSLAMSVSAESVETIDLYIQMTVEEQDGTIIADLVDDRGGTVSSWPVSLVIDGVTVDTINTDYEGSAVFNYDIPDDADEVSCLAHDGGFDVYRFIGCEVFLDRESVDESEDTTSEPFDETTTSAQDETTSVQEGESTAAPTTTSTDSKSDGDSLATAPFTTSAKGNHVAIGIDVNHALIDASQTLAADFTSRGRVWMDTDVYKSLVSTTVATLHMQLTLNESAGQASILVAAKNADPTYAGYDDSLVTGFAMDMSLVYVDGFTRVPLEIEDGMYNIELPVPESMKNCEKIAVAVCTGDGLAPFVEVKPSGGVLNFTLQRFQTLAIVGFGDQGSAMNSLSQTPWLLIVIVIVGLLLIAGGIVLLVLVTFRRKKAVRLGNDSTAKDATRRVLLDPEEEEFLDTAEATNGNDQPKAVLLECDEQSELSGEEREAFRAKSPADTRSFDTISSESVPPARQIESDQINTPQSSATKKEYISVDDVLDEVLSDLEDLDS